MVAKAIEVRGLKLKITKIPIPVSYSAAFEGERVRKEELQVEFGRGELSRPSSTCAAASWTRSRTGRSS